MTLKQLWEQRGLNPTQLAGQAGISTTTLYKMNRKEKVHSRNVVAVCRILEIEREEYNALEAERVMN